MAGSKDVRGVPGAPKGFPAKYHHPQQQNKSAPTLTSEAGAQSALVFMSLKQIQDRISVIANSFRFLRFINEDSSLAAAAAAATTTTLR
ncbi:Hypothetical predicted protein [Olea europaea subsp. europaea]|uniref:Uncharacterized protein n=1 Tax=Olea europaea subsp. europaea TaxID=158383 RepID=A0A8S0VNV7_OLEEU|nr:Hypothetical predicted protein [Olea europaea subsp. europaea]